MAANPIEAEHGRDKPADGGQEREGLVGLEGAAVVAVEADAAPVEGVTAAAVEPVHQQTEDGEPAGRDDEVDGPVDEAAGEGEQPKEGEQDGQPSDHLGVDEAPQGPGRLSSVGVQVVSGYTCDDGREDQLQRGSASSFECGLSGCRVKPYLRQAEYHGDEIGQDHGDGWLVGNRLALRLEGGYKSIEHC